MNNIKSAHDVQKENSRDEQRAWRIGPRTVNCWSTMLLLPNSDHEEVNYGSNSGTWTCRFRVVRSNPTSDKISAKWRAGTSTQV